MHVFLEGLIVGTFIGSIVTALWADSLIKATVAEVKKLEAGVTSEFQRAETAAQHFISDVKKDL